MHFPATSTSAPCPFHYKHKETRCWQNLSIETNYDSEDDRAVLFYAQLYSVVRWKWKLASFVERKTHLSSYLRNGGLIRRVNEFRCIVVDVRHSHDHRNHPLFVGQFHRAAQLKNEWIFISQNKYKNLTASSPSLYCHSLITLPKCR